MATTKKPSMSVITTRGLKYSSGVVLEEYLSKLRYPAAAKVYTEMANDDTLGAVIYLAEMLVSSVDWAVEGGTSNKEATEFLTSCLDDMEVTWRQCISEILAMFVYGFQVTEILYKVRKGPQNNPALSSKYTDGKIGWRNFQPVSAASLDKWEFDDNGVCIGMHQLDPGTFKEAYLPFTKAMLFRTKVRSGNPEGQSLMRAAYKAYWYKCRLQEIEAIGFERSLAGTPVLIAPEDIDLFNPDDPEMVELRQRAESLVQGLRTDAQAGVVLPAGWSLDLLGAKGNAGNIGEVIERYDTRMAQALLSDIVLIGNGSKAGSYALADVKQSLLSQALQTQLKNIEDIINDKAVYDLMLINGFDVEDLPRLKAGNIIQLSARDIAQILRAAGMTAMQDVDLHNNIRRFLGLDAVTQDEFDSIVALETDIEAAPNATGTAAEVDQRVRGDIKDSGDTRVKDDSAQRDFEMPEQYR